MARNGAGTYTLPAGNPVTTGTTISSTWANNTLTDIGNTLTASLASDGQTIPTANLPMGAYVHTNVGAATTRTNYAQSAQVQDGTYSTLSAVSGTDTITATGPIGVSAYAAGQYFNFVAAGANTTTGVTLNINSIGAKNITKNGATALSIGDIASGQMVSVIYDGTQFQLQSGILGVTSFNAGTTGFTPSSSTKGSVTLAGTLNIANGGTGSTSTTYCNLASNVTGTLPVANGGTGATTGGAAINNLLTPTTAGNVIFTTDGTNWSSTQKIVRGTAITLSGTTQSFSSIPAWVKRITFMMNGIYGSGSSHFLVQLGTSSGTTITGYVSSSLTTVTSQLSTTSTAGMVIYNATSSVSNTTAGMMTFVNITGNSWLCTSLGRCSSTNTFTGNGFVSLGSTLTSLTFTTVNGTDTLNGTINIIYE